jgi:DNA-binding MarR family transcriptional regulator
MMATRSRNGALRAVELDAWRALMRGQATLAHELETDLEAANGLPLRSFTVLFELEQVPGRRLRMSELAEAAGLSRSGLSRLIDRLVADGLIERAECCDDGRGSFAVLTRRGQARLDAARGTHSEAIRRLFVGRFTSAELRQLSGFLGRIHD